MSEQDQEGYQPPPRPWKKGVHQTYKALVLEVHVCQDETGRVWSSNSFQGSEDEQTALKMPQGGTEQVAYALLTEALRREVFVDALVHLSRDPQFLVHYVAGDPETREEMEEHLTRAAREVMFTTMEKMGTAPAKEVLDLMLQAQEVGSAETDLG